MERIRIPTDNHIGYFETKNGSVVRSDDGIDFWFEEHYDDVYYNGTAIGYNNDLKANGKSTHLNVSGGGYDIVSKILYLKDRITEIECNVKIGDEFEYIGNDTRTTKGNNYKVFGIHVYEDGVFSLDYYNDRGQLSTISDFNDIIIRDNNG